MCLSFGQVKPRFAKLTRAEFFASSSQFVIVKLETAAEKPKFETMPRSYTEELQYIERISQNAYKIKKGFVPNMKVCFENSRSVH